ncbi:MAG: dual specificity protein phosphatase family protein [Gammaproteobacteria bacterium]|nr:dual specificity protein phosphatase family protein [Gammaproteobacteria bacterium]
MLDDVFIGTCPVRASDVRRLKSALGVSAVLNLQTDEDFERWRIDWPALLTAYGEHQIAVERVPIRDFDPDDLAARVAHAAERPARLVEVGHRVYVHCTAGQQRSPAAVICYLVSRHGYDLEAAFAGVSENRRCSPDMGALAAACGGGPGPVPRSDEES